MEVSDGIVQITLELPGEVYQRVVMTATGEQRQLKELLAALVAEGLDVHATTEEILDRVSSAYRAQRAREMERVSPPSAEERQRALQRLRLLGSRVDDRQTDHWRRALDVRA